MEYKDYYKILGVARTATADEIKQSYRKLARKYHPDVSKEPNAEAKFKEVGEAYEVLKDPEKRSQYDQLGMDWKAGQEFKPPPGWQQQHAQNEYVDMGDFSEFFANIFGQGGAGAHTRHHRQGFHRQQSMRGEDLHYRLSISLEDAYHGATRQLQIPLTEIDQQGMARQTSRTLNVKIPAGVKEGQQIRLAGQGNTLTGAPAGDLYLEIQIQPHTLFTLNNKDVHLILPIAPWEAALGATVPVPTLGGNVELKIPAGSQAGQQLRLKDRGLPGNPAGDQFVTLKIVVPAANTDKAREIYQTMAKDLAFNPREKLGVST